MGQFYVYGLYAPGRAKGELFYIGKGKNRRMNQHFEGNHRCKNLHKQSVIKKYPNSYPKIIRQGLSENAAYTLEMELIKEFRPQLTNLTDGGEGRKGHTPSFETRAKMSLSSTGKKHTDQSKIKISKANLERWKDPEFSKRMSNINKMIWASSPGRKQELSKRWTGGKHTEETKSKISDKNKIRMPGEGNPRAILNWSKVREIRRRAKIDKVTHRQLSIDYGVSIGTIRRVIYNETWKE